jgi:hypothetical protein
VHRGRAKSGVRRAIEAIAILLTAHCQSACGALLPEQPEIWDRADPLATQHMEMQIKRAVYCELREAVIIARRNFNQRYYGGKPVTTKDDQPLPDSWGAQITFTFTVDETSKLTPGATLNTVMPSIVTTFPGKAAVTTPQSFAFGLGGTLSSEANRVDTFDTFYTIGDIAYVYGQKNDCNDINPDLMGPDSHSSLFLVKSNLGIIEWLPQAFEVSDFLRSSRASPTGEGPALGGSTGQASDSISYHIKYIVVSEANATPMWKLVRVSANTSPTLLDVNRTRTHDLLITIGPGNFRTVKTTKGPVRQFVPSQSAANSHLAQQIGSAVQDALRTGQ